MSGQVKENTRSSIILNLEITKKGENILVMKVMRGAKSASATAAHFTLGTFSIIRSASNSGILLSINSATMPIVPAIISKTLKSIAPRILPTGSIPVITKISADPRAM